MAAPVWGDLGQLAAAQPMLLRALVGVAGAVLLVAGARLYRPALFLAGFGAGAAGTVAGLLTLAQWIPALSAPTVLVVAGLVGGALLCVLTLMVHRIGLIGVGGLVGATGAASIAGVMSAAPPWWAPIAGAIVGAVLLPYLFPVLLTVVTPAVGAVLIAWAAGHPSHPVLLIGVWAVGCVVQLASRGPKRGKRAAEEEEE